MKIFSFHVYTYIHTQLSLYTLSFLIMYIAHINIITLNYLQVYNKNKFYLYKNFKKFSVYYI